MGVDIDLVVEKLELESQFADNKLCFVAKTLVVGVVGIDLKVLL